MSHSEGGCQHPREFVAAKSWIKSSVAKSCSRVVSNRSWNTPSKLMRCPRLSRLVFSSNVTTAGAHRARPVMSCDVTAEQEQRNLHENTDQVPAPRLQPRGAGLTSGDSLLESARPRLCHRTHTAVNMLPARNQARILLTDQKQQSDASHTSDCSLCVTVKRADLSRGAWRERVDLVFSFYFLHEWIWVQALVCFCLLSVLFPSSVPLVCSPPHAWHFFSI